MLLSRSFSRSCAIVGGVLTVAALFDSVLFATGRRLKMGGGANGSTKVL